MKNLLLLISFLCFQLSAKSQIDAPALPLPEAYFTAVIVSDISQSIKWYSKNLGFKVLNQNENEAMGLKQANLKCGNILIELIQLKQVLIPDELLKDYPRGTKIGGFFKFGLQVERFDKWTKHLENNKVTFHGKVVIDPTSGKKMVIIKDPDGNRIQLFEK